MNALGKWDSICNLRLRENTAKHTYPVGTDWDAQDGEYASNKPCLFHDVGALNNTRVSRKGFKLFKFPIANVDFFSSSCVEHEAEMN